MAIAKVPETSKLGLKVDNGVGANGKAVYKTRQFSNLKTDATDADVYAVATALAGLQQHTLAGVVRIDQGSLVSR